MTSIVSARRGGSSSPWTDGPSSTASILGTENLLLDAFRFVGRQGRQFVMARNGAFAIRSRSEMTLAQYIAALAPGHDRRIDTMGLPSIGATPKLRRGGRGDARDRLDFALDECRAHEDSRLQPRFARSRRWQVTEKWLP